MKLKNIVKVVLSVCIMLTAFMFVGCDNNALKEINYVNGTIQTSIRQGDTIDLSNAEVELIYSKGNTEIISATDLEFSTFDSSILGDQTLTITYKGKSVNVVVNVYKYVNTVSIKEGTIALTVLQNHQIDTSNVVLVETYSDGSTAEITSEQLTFGNFSTENVGTFPLEVTYNGNTATVNITVEKYICSDINADLINLWNYIKTDYTDVVNHYSDLWYELNKDNDLDRKREFFKLELARNPRNFRFMG